MVIDTSADGFLTVDEFMATYKIGRTTFYSIVGAGNLPLIKVGRASRISKRAARAWADGLQAVSA